MNTMSSVSLTVASMLLAGCAGFGLKHPTTYAVQLDDQQFSIDVPEAPDGPFATHLRNVSLHDETQFDRSGLRRILNLTWNYRGDVLFFRTTGTLDFKVLLARASQDDVRDNDTLKREIHTSLNRSFAYLGLPFDSPIEEHSINGRTWLKYHHVLIGEEFATAIAPKRYLKVRFSYIDNGSARWHSRADRLVDSIRTSMRLRTHANEQH